MSQTFYEYVSTFRFPAFYVSFKFHLALRIWLVSTTSHTVLSHNVLDYTTCVKVGFHFTFLEAIFEITLTVEKIKHEISRFASVRITSVIF
jgi:hypothetical protein